MTAFAIQSATTRIKLASIKEAVSDAYIQDLMRRGVSAPLRTFDDNVFIDSEKALALATKGETVHLDDLPAPTLFGTRNAETPWGKQIGQSFGTALKFNRIEAHHFIISIDWSTYHQETLHQSLLTGKVERTECAFDLPITPMLRGIKGMEIADWVLKKYKTVGLLLGSNAKEIWRDTKEVLDSLTLLNHHDIDVYILAFNPDKHRREGGIDWWKSRNAGEPPANFWTSHVKLDASIELLNLRIRPGLYLPPRELVEEWNKVEMHKTRNGRPIKIFPVRQTPRLDLFPILPRESFRVHWFK